MNNEKFFGALVFVAVAMSGCAGADEAGPAAQKIPNGTVVAVSDNLLIAVSRDSGETWKTIMQDQTGLPEAESLLVRASYIPETGRFFAFGWKMFTSTDGATFQKLESPIKDWSGDVVYGNGIYLAGGGFGQVITSTDGITWTDKSVVPGVDVTGIRSAAFGGGKFAMADAKGNVFISSDDGATWVPDPLKTDNVDFCEGAFKDGSKCGHSSATQAVWSGHGYLFRAGEPGKPLRRSGDGVTFKEVGVIAPRDLAFGPPM